MNPLETLQNRQIEPLDAAIENVSSFCVGTVSDSTSQIEHVQEAFESAQAVSSVSACQSVIPESAKVSAVVESGSTSYFSRDSEQRPTETEELP